MTNACGSRSQEITPELNIQPIFSAIPSTFVCDADCEEIITVNIETVQLGHNYEVKLLKNGALQQEITINEITQSQATQVFEVEGYGNYTVLVKNKNDFGVCEVAKEVTIDRKEVAKEGRYFSFTKQIAYTHHISMRMIFTKGLIRLRRGFRFRRGI